MRHFALTLEAQSPLAIRSDHAAVGVGSAGYIAGSALAGSLASVHRLAHPADTALFERLFLSGQARYPDLYPADFKSASLRKAQQLPVFPLPKTAQSCKRFPGFFPLEDEEPDEDRHGVRDTLLDWGMFALGDQKPLKAGQPPIAPATLLKLLERHKQCDCDKPMDHFGGYYRRNERNMGKATLETRLQTHTGINRKTGAVQEGILYHRRVFEEHACFWGLLKIADDLAGPFAAFIEEVGGTGLVRIGTSRTRGMGKVSLRVQALDAEEDEQRAQEEQAHYQQFKERLTRFSSLLGEQAQETYRPGDDLTLDPFYFALTLHSPLILCDDLLRYRGAIDKEALGDLLHLPADSFRLLYQAASTRRVSGWNELWGTPRTNEYAIDTGSVFLFAATINPDEALLRALFTLEEEGAGRRRAEGFGRIVVSDAFHQEVTLK